MPKNTKVVKTTKSEPKAESTKVVAKADAKAKVDTKKKVVDTKKKVVVATKKVSAKKVVSKKAAPKKVTAKKVASKKVAASKKSTKKAKTAKTTKTAKTAKTTKTAKTAKKVVKKTKTDTTESGSHGRFFKVILDDESPHGRFSGTKPKQAAAKALTSILRSREENGEAIEGQKINFSIVECTRGSRHKTYNYVGERVQLDEPMEITIGKGDKAKVITYRYNNKVMKAKSA